MDGIGASLEGPAESLYIYQTYSKNSLSSSCTYPGLDITAVFLPFFRRDGAADAGGLGADSDVSLLPLASSRE